MGGSNVERVSIVEDKEIENFESIEKGFIEQMDDRDNNCRNAQFFKKNKKFSEGLGSVYHHGPESTPIEPPCKRR